MKNPTKLGIFLFAGLFAVVVRAEPLNFDIGYSKLHYKETKYPTDDVDHVKIAVSRNNFEALTSFNVKSSKGTLSGSAYELKLPYIWGLYYKPEISLGSGVNVFARIGGANAKVQIQSLDGKIKSTADLNGLSYGFGMSMLSTRTSKITLDYTSYHNGGGVNVNGFSLTHTFLLP